MKFPGRLRVEPLSLLGTYTKSQQLQFSSWLCFWASQPLIHLGKVIYCIIYHLSIETLSIVCVCLTRKFEPETTLSTLNNLFQLSAL